MTRKYENCGGPGIRHIVPSHQDSLIVSDSSVIVVDNSIRDETTFRVVE